MYTKDFKIQERRQVAYIACSVFFDKSHIQCIEELFIGSDIEIKLLVELVTGEKYLIKTTSNKCFTESKYQQLRNCSDSIICPLNAYFCKDKGVFAICYPWIEGKSLKNELPNNCNKYAKQCAEILKNMHKVSCHKKENDIYGEFQYRYRYCLEQNINLKYSRLWMLYFQKYKDIVKNCNRKIGLIHGDVKPDNIICAGNRIFMIDIENCIYTDVWQEFIGFTMMRSDNQEQFYLDIIKEYFGNIIPDKFYEYLSYMSVIALYRSAIWAYHHNDIINIALQENYLFENFDWKSMKIRTWLHKKL